MTEISAVVLGLTLAACGNYSTEDLRFLAALPTRDDLQVSVPSQGNQGAATVCPNGAADVWLWAKPTSDRLNSGVEFLISLIDVVRHHAPTARAEDMRRWGPFPAERHPGKEIQIVLTRSFPPALGGAPAYAYVFEARTVGAPTFDPLIAGTFEGASAARGRGNVTVFFDTFWTVGVNDLTTPHGTMQIPYDRVSDPVTIGLQLTNDGFNVVQFDYGFAGYRDGRGAFDYRFRNLAGDVLTVATGFDAAGAGRAAVTYVAAGGGTGSFDQCWDAAACLSYVLDPANFSCPLHASCSFGSVIPDCPAVPVSPF